MPEMAVGDEAYGEAVSAKGNFSGDTGTYSS